MSRQAVIEIGCYSVKAGLWEQTFLPNHIIASFGDIKDDKWVPAGQAVKTIERGMPANFNYLKALLYVFLLILLFFREYVLFSELNLQKPWTDVCVLFVLPPSWKMHHKMDLLQIMFEQFGVAGVFLGDEALMAAFGCALANTLVVLFGHELINVSAVVDSEVVEWEQIESLKSVEELAMAMVTVVNRVEAEKRPTLFENILLCGPSSVDEKENVEKSLFPLLAISEYCGDHQPTHLKFKTVPEYYPELWEKATPYAAWFGGGIVAKVSFSDPKSFITREDWNSNSVKNFQLGMVWLLCGTREHPRKLGVADTIGACVRSRVLKMLESLSFDQRRDQEDVDGTAVVKQGLVVQYYHS